MEVWRWESVGDESLVAEDQSGCDGLCASKNAMNDRNRLAAERKVQAKL